MSFTVKLALFPAWKAPIPIETVGTYTGHAEASAAGVRALLPIAEREIAAMAIGKNPDRRATALGTVTSIQVPDASVHGYVVYDAEGIEVGNWTTLDVAIERADATSS